MEHELISEVEDVEEKLTSTGDVNEWIRLRPRLGRVP